MNNGHSSRLPYDVCAYPDKLEESVAPGEYRLNPTKIHNCNKCLSTLGPRSSYMGFGDSSVVGFPIAPSQAQVDLESILTNRNVKNSKCKKGRVNPIDVTQMNLDHAKICDHTLDPMSSRLVYPPQTFREMAINRFYNLPKDPQANIFWNFEIDSKLEAKDNFVPEIYMPSDNDKTLPVEVKGRVKQPHYHADAYCPYDDSAN